MLEDEVKILLKWTVEKFLVDTFPGVKEVVYKGKLQ